MWRAADGDPAIDVVAFSGNGVSPGRIWLLGSIRRIHGRKPTSGD
jgi:hypothetical protein